MDDELLKAAVEEDPRQTIRTLSQRLDAPWSTVQEHLKKIGKVYREGRWVPHELSPANKAMRATICKFLRNEKTLFLDRIVTGDEKSLGWEVLPHPPYSPDLAPSDFHLFRSLEHFISGKRFINVHEVEAELNSFISSKDVNFFERGIKKLPSRWTKVISNDGDYFVEQ